MRQNLYANMEDFCRDSHICEWPDLKPSTCTHVHKQLQSTVFLLPTELHVTNLQDALVTIMPKIAQILNPWHVLLARQQTIYSRLAACPATFIMNVWQASK